MATIPVPLPDAYSPEAANAPWELFPPPAVPDGQTQITKAANVVRVLRWHLKMAVLESRRRAARVASDAALVQVETDLA
jgi:hypothetical protein